MSDDLLHPQLLRTFLAVAQSLSFTQAATHLGLSQPTVSARIRRLEEAVDRRLFERDTRTVVLSEDGEVLAGFARTILAAQEQAHSYFAGSQLRGRLRFGAADDLALTQLPRILRDFRQQHPQIDLELTVTQSATLHRRLETGHLDLIFVKHGAGDGPGDLVRREPLVWVGVHGLRLPPSEPVPLIAYRAPSFSRSASMRALEKVNRTWRVTCVVREINGVLAACRAGLGVAAFAQSLVPGDLVRVPAQYGLPDLGDVDIVLLGNPRAVAGPVQALTSAIMNSAPTLSAAARATAP
jgi:DNA-binding transcriptional LysR family regulator